MTEDGAGTFTVTGLIVQHGLAVLEAAAGRG